MTTRSTIITTFLCAGAALVAAALFGCRSAPVVIPDDLGPAETFQRAQDAADRGDYALAIRYYSVFRDKHPDLKDRTAWATYEIAFNYHKMGKDALALAQLEDLFKQYDTDSDTLPPAPRVLAQKLRDRLSAAALKPAP